MPQSPNPNPHLDIAVPSPLLTVAQTAERLQLSPRSIRRLIATGALTVHRLGRAVRIAEIDLAQFLKDNRDI